MGLINQNRQEATEESTMRRTRAGRARKLPFDEFNGERKLISSDYETHVCLTEADCRAQARSEGLELQLVGGPKLSKGCFRKGDKNVAYWGEGGTTEDISTPHLPGVQKRLYCNSSVSGKEAIEEVVPSSKESDVVHASEDEIIAATSGDSRDFVIEEEETMIEIDTIALDVVEEKKFEESFDAIPQEVDGGYSSKMVISSIVVGSVVFLAFVLLFLVAKARSNSKGRRDEEGSDRHWIITSTSSEITPKMSNTRSSKLTRSIPTGVAKDTIDEEYYI